MSIVLRKMEDQYVKPAKKDFDNELKAKEAENIRLGKEADEKREADNKRLAEEAKQKKAEEKALEEIGGLDDDRLIGELPAGSDYRFECPEPSAVSTGYKAFNPSKETEYAGVKKGEVIVYKSKDHSYCKPSNYEAKYFLLRLKESNNPSHYSEYDRMNWQIVNPNGKLLTIHGYKLFHNVRYVSELECYYITILSGNSIHDKYEARMKYLDINMANRLAGCKNYIDEGLYRLLLKQNKTLKRPWYGTLVYFDKGIILKTDKNFKVLEQLNGYIPLGH